MVVDNKTLRFQDSFESESGEELSHFLLGTRSNLVPMHGASLGHLQEGRDLGKPREPLRATEGVGGSQHFRTPEKPDGRTLRGYRVSHSWDKRTHKKAVVWAMSGTLLERRHLEGARVGKCCTQSHHDSHPGLDVCPPTAKLFHKPNAATTTSKTERRP